MRRIPVTAALALLLLASQTSFAEPDQLTRGLEALRRGAHGEAIAELERIADHGFTHPDASYDRAVAYAMRARSPQAKPGDLGQAAAGLVEALLHRPNDEGAEAALRVVQSEIARARSRRGAPPVSVRPTIDRAILAAAPENVWSILAAAGSGVLTLSIVLARLGGKPATRLASGVGAWIGGLVLVVCGVLAFGAQHLRRTTQPGVIVASEARIRDHRGAPIVQRDGVPEHVAIPEGAEVEIHRRAANLSRFRWGSIEGHIQTSDVRALAPP